MMPTFKVAFKASSSHNYSDIKTCSNSQESEPKTQVKRTTMASVTTNDIRVGMKVEVDKEPYLIINNEFVKPGKGQAFNRIKIKNMINGKVVEKTYKSGEKLDLADIEEHQMRFVYKEPDGAVFMDEKTFDQISISNETIGSNQQWLMEETVFQVIFYKGVVIELTPPTFMEMIVTETTPGVRGDTSGRVLKAATTETGAKIQIPIFVAEGEKIKVDTRTCEYVSRAS
jgi:elongation factor P